MSESHPTPRRRSRVSERAHESYTEPMQQPTDYAPEETDYSAYYSRQGAEHAQQDQPAFAAPAKLQHYGYESQLRQPEEMQSEQTYGAGNVYRPREATWAEERQDVLAESELGYQVQAEAAPKRKRKKKRHALRNTLIVLLVLALIAGGLWLARKPILEWLKEEEIIPAATEEPFMPVVTPEPIKAFDAAASIEMAGTARNAISRISGSVQMESHIVTDTHIVTRNQRKDGSYDFYLFSSPEGRLLCYFEGLEKQDMIPQEGGSFHVKQAPYLIAANGSALLRMEDSLYLHPLYRGWSVAENREDGSANYVNLSGQFISNLWFSRTFPFTGEYTLAYVDTGSTADADQRYLLYVLKDDGTMSRWLSSGSMQEVTACAGGMAYLNDGSLYRLPDTSKPVLTTPEVHAYLDCDAMVVQDGQSGKYGLFVHGEQHYDFIYDSIQPVSSDLVWAEKVLAGGAGSMTVHAVSGASYPQPLSHSFVLERDGQREYVALSTQSSYPILLDGEF